MEESLLALSDEELQTKVLALQQEYRQARQHTAGLQSQLS